MLIHREHTVIQSVVTTSHPKFQTLESDPKQDMQAACHDTARSRPGLTSLIVPIWLSCVDNPKREILTYAFLDS